jgi:hypothetical protein
MKHEELTGAELSGIALFEGLPESELRSCAELMRRTEVLMGNKLTTEADFGYSSSSSSRAESESALATRFWQKSQPATISARCRCYNTTNAMRRLLPWKHANWQM